jgi:hypothetical protein
MKKVKETRNQIIKWTLIAFAVSIFLSLIILDEPKDMILGLIFGTAIGILNFIELEKTLIKSARMEPGKAQTFAMAKYFLRFAIMAVVLFISIKAPYINVIGTIIGLLLIKFVIMATNLFKDKDYYKRIFRREG